MLNKYAGIQRVVVCWHQVRVFTANLQDRGPSFQVLTFLQLYLILYTIPM